MPPTLPIHDIQSYTHYCDHKIYNEVESGSNQPANKQSPCG